MTATLKSGAIQTQYRIIDGLNVRFAGGDPCDDHALLLSPWPKSLFAFDQMWDRLAEDTHRVTVDLPGFGHSERRDTLLAPRAMGEFVIWLADEFGLEHPFVLLYEVGWGRIGAAAKDIN